MSNEIITSSNSQTSKLLNFKNIFGSNIIFVVTLPACGKTTARTNLIKEGMDQKDILDTDDYLGDMSYTSIGHWCRQLSNKKSDTIVFSNLFEFVPYFKNIGTVFIFAPSSFQIYDTMYYTKPATHVDRLTLRLWYDGYFRTEYTINTIDKRISEFKGGLLNLLIKSEAA